MTEIKKIKLNNFEIGGDKLTILAGPCVIEDKAIIFETAKSISLYRQANGIAATVRSLVNSERVLPFRLENIIPAILQVIFSP
jgi:3-deoxy-D-manno-octulosonic acid (KDO) 8-phosphate synthase